MLYHVSQVSGLKVLKPHVSTHKKAYVYAIENVVTGLLFGAPKDDFDFLIRENGDGIPVLYECYPEAMQKKYQGRSCSVYEVSEEGFLRGMTSWDPELVSETEVTVLREVPVSDLYQRLLEEEKQGNLLIHRYESSEEYRKLIAGHVVDRCIRFGLDLNQYMEREERFATYYKELVLALLQVMDGHLLQ